MGVNLFGLIFAGFSGIFLFVGAMLARKQAHRLATYRPVPAEVLSSDVASGTGSKGGTTYSPNIRFSYHIAGRTLEADTPLAMGKMSSSGQWAHKIVARYPAGMKTSAYVDPEDEKKVFLVRDVSFFPYIFILFPMIHFAIGLGLTLGGGDKPVCSEALAVLITALAWNATGAACLFHFRSAGGRMDLGTKIAFMLYGGAGVILLVVASHLAANPPEPPTTQPTTQDAPLEAE